MSLLKRLDSDMVTAAKARDAERLEAIRYVRSEVANRRLELDRDVSDDDVIEILSRVAKKLKEAVEQFEGAGREDIAAPERRKLAVVESYLPERLSGDELLRVVRDAIEEAGATSKRDLGAVMKHVMPQVKGRADGNEVRRVAEELLSGAAEA